MARAVAQHAVVAPHDARVVPARVTYAVQAYTTTRPRSVPVAPRKAQKRKLVLLHRVLLAVQRPTAAKDTAAQRKLL